jgi:hypothetical protein
MCVRPRPACVFLSLYLYVVISTCTDSTGLTQGGPELRRAPLGHSLMSLKAHPQKPRSRPPAPPAGPLKLYCYNVLATRYRYSSLSNCLYSCTVYISYTNRTVCTVVLYVGILILALKSHSRLLEILRAAGSDVLKKYSTSHQYAATGSDHRSTLYRRCVKSLQSGVYGTTHSSCTVCMTYDVSVIGLMSRDLSVWPRTLNARRQHGVHASEHAEQFIRFLFSQSQSQCLAPSVAPK